MRRADENVLVNLVCEFHNGHFQDVITFIFYQTYNTALYEPQVGIYYEGRPESEDRLPAGVLLPERNRCFKSFSGVFLSIRHIFQSFPKRCLLVPNIKEFLGGRRFKAMPLRNG
jgi:hypothetical protein